MKRTVGLRTTVALSIASLLLGAALCWGLQLRMQLQAFESLALSHELETTGLCVGSLNLHLAQDPDRMVRLLQQRLDATVAQAMLLTDHGVRLMGPMPNLREGVRRTAAYYASIGDVDHQRTAETLLARLQSTP